MDIVQGANAVAARKLNELDLQDHASIMRWLSQIVLNQIRDANDYFSRDKRNVDLQVAMDFGSGANEASDQPVYQGTSDDPLPEEEAWRRELRDILDDSMTKLPEEYREVILQRDYYGAEWPEITELVGKPTVHAAQEFHRRAWIKLRRIVRPRLDGLI